ncbi:fungal-specific transcription factor domain-domain-containing protein [Clohesyomyces aquaticus]|uniref:Fungal-specific transcription factor domain-domain-containing protein n=1 Tax=Clohesyomyces aquaticus TaxID=1231657 RepID=A0A1Y1YD15_9PLEO|nr:fungal-specific transcription factor domain-domain-containing protein [Clohesyomyces aquaticus]
MMISTPTTSSSRRVPLDKRKRTETSCDKCKSRKQKCRKEPGQDACRYCSLHNIECLTTQPRKKRLYGSVEGLGNRLALLESLVKGLLPEADVSNMDEMRQLGSSLGIPLPDSAAVGDANGEQSRNSSGNEADESLPLLPDQQGQVQYIGPSSSFSFHLKLRTLVGSGAVREFVLFGRNAADQDPLAEGDHDPHTLSTPSATSNIDQNSPADQRASTSETPSLESLISAYFEHINPDFPVLHEASFREAYEAWILDPNQADPAWLCSFLCVLLLSRRVVRITFQEEQERFWWRRVQTLLPVVIFTSSITAVQGLMLAAIHLHNTNHRDACWNLTGTAVRIAFAIGLHQDKVNTMQTPLARELRKRLWWTLYAFEQMQVSSYDRPSAIEHPSSKIGCPNERIIGMAGYCPPDYTKWLNRLVVHLGSACRAPKNTKASSSEESYVGPLSPAASVLRDLDRWKDSIPAHLRIENADTSPPSFQRPLLLLHAMYHYTVVVLCRAALLARATSLSRDGRDSKNTALTSMSDACVASGRTLARILLKLDSMGKLDAITWWDVWYALSCASVLVLDLVCGAKQNDSHLSDSKILLSQLADLATKQRRNPHMPGTIDKFAAIVVELHSMADTMTARAQPLKLKIETRPEHPAPLKELSPSNHSDPPYPYQSKTNSGAYIFGDNVAGRYFPDVDFAGGDAGGAASGGSSFPNTRFDRGSQMSFMDFTINNIGDWNWADLGSLLGNDGGISHPGG